MSCYEKLLYARKNNEQVSARQNTLLSLTHETRAPSAGAYGLPQLQAARGYRVYDDDPDYRFVFEYPASWVGRTNTLRDGVYFSDFNVSPPVPIIVWSRAVKHFVKCLRLKCVRRQGEVRAKDEGPEGGLSSTLIGVS